MSKRRNVYDSSKPIGVIGSGLAGLSAAAVLAARGHKVVVFEKNSWLGGKAAVLHQKGYRFDMGPTILTMPNVLKRIFKEAGRNMSDYLKLVRLDPQWRCFFDDGSTLDLVEDRAKLAESINKRQPGSGDGYRKFLLLAEELHRITERWFFWKPVSGVMDTMSLPSFLNPAALKDLMTLRMGKSVGDVIREFVPDQRSAQMLDHFTQYVGSCPESSPAVLCSIASMQVNEGVWYPIGGTRAVPEALVKLGGELGVDYRTNVDIKRIIHEGGWTSGVETTTGEIIELSAIVSNSDAVRTHTELVGGGPGAAFVKDNPLEAACSGVVLYMGLNKRYEHLQHHDFVFSRDPHEEFEYIYRKGEPAPDPTAYLCCPSFSEPGVAPPGGEALYVLVHTPYLRPHHNWEKMFPAYRKVIIEKLKRTAGMKDLEERIVTESALTPQSIHNRYRVLNGAIYGVASHGKYFGAFKPNNRSSALKGLYLAGGAAHPGPGMPMVLMSGWIAADAVHQDVAAPKVA